MGRIRSYYDADRIEGFPPTKHLTDQNKNKLHCSICGEVVYADDIVFRDVTRVIEETTENPFLCEECLIEYEEAAHR